MSDLALPTFRVRIEFTPYSHQAVQDLLKEITLDFGPPGARARRWYFETTQTADTEPNDWMVDFVFHHPHDAVVFGLRHQR